MNMCLVMRNSFDTLDNDNVTTCVCCFCAYLIQHTDDNNRNICVFMRVSLTHFVYLCISHSTHFQKFVISILIRVYL